MTRIGQLSRRSTVGHRQILFFDDFNGTAGQSVDSSKWAVEEGRYSADQGGNDYASPNNVALDGNGHLELKVLQNVGGTAPDNAAAPDNITSGRISTLGKARFLPPYRIEARIKFPTTAGLLPAFWTCGVAPGTWTEDWPRYGEIDIAELEGGIDDSAVDTYLHMGTVGDSYTDNPIGTTAAVGAPADQDYHVYGVDVHTDSVRHMIDGTTTSIVTQSMAVANNSEWPYATSPQFLILSVYVGPDWMGEADPSLTNLGSMFVDWVQVTSL